MSIRWANCLINRNNLEIIFPTSFALKWTNTEDNKALIKKALTELNLDNIGLILKTK